MNHCSCQQKRKKSRKANQKRRKQADFQISLNRIQIVLEFAWKQSIIVKTQTQQYYFLRFPKMGQSGLPSSFQVGSRSLIRNCPLTRSQSLAGMSPSHSDANISKFAWETPSATRCGRSIVRSLDCSSLNSFSLSERVCNDSAWLYIYIYI